MFAVESETLNTGLQHSAFKTKLSKPWKAGMVDASDLERVSLTSNVIFATSSCHHSVRFSCDAHNVMFICRSSVEGTSTWQRDIET